MFKRFLSLALTVLMVIPPAFSQEFVDPNNEQTATPPMAPMPSMQSSSRTSSSYYFDKIRVHVYGAINNPGVYPVPPSARLSEVLLMAGDIKPTGSDRRVELRRSKKFIQTIDLLELRRKADLSQNPYVQNNDVIFVPLKGKSVIIQGAVKEPGMYELVSESSLQEVVDLTLGFTVGLSEKSPILVIRFDDSNKKIVENIAITPEAMRNFKMQDGDIVQVPHKFTANKSFDNSINQLPNDNISYPSYLDKVFVVGGVKMPKAFPYNPHFTISNYIAMAGGLSRFGKRKAVVTQLNGNATKMNISSRFDINPGDTIDVREAKLGVDFWITFMTTLAGLGLSAIAITR